MGWARGDALGGRQGEGGRKGSKVSRGHQPPRTGSSTIHMHVYLQADRPSWPHSLTAAAKSPDFQDMF